MKNKSSKIRPEVQWFSSRMEEKLAKNDHKTHWECLDFETLILKLEIEFAKLKIAWKKCINNRQVGDKATNEELINDCIDVANYAMMLADKFNKYQGSSKINK